MKNKIELMSSSRYFPPKYDVSAIDTVGRSQASDLDLRTGRDALKTYRLHLHAPFWLVTVVSLYENDFKIALHLVASKYVNNLKQSMETNDLVAFCVQNWGELQTRSVKRQGNRILHH